MRHQYAMAWNARTHGLTWSMQMAPAGVRVGAPDSEAFADAVDAYQTERGLPGGGRVGASTVAAWAADDVPRAPPPPVVPYAQNEATAVVVVVETPPPQNGDAKAPPSSAAAPAPDMAPATPKRRRR